VSKDNLMMTESLKIAYLDDARSELGAKKYQFETYMKQISSFSVSEENGALALLGKNYDLAVISAFHVPEEHFLSWLQQLIVKMDKQSNVWIPALVLADLPFEIYTRAASEVLQTNWYFDIMHPDHMSSLPIRISNLIRMMNHLKELRNYAEKINSLSQDVLDIKRQVNKTHQKSQKL